MTKIILAVIIVISWACGLYVYFTGLKTQSAPIPFDYLFPLIFVIDILSGRYLYSRAKDKKAEWALFGLLGNITAIIVYWIFNHTKESHKQGKSIFGPQ